jgi:ArsR family transcriptional regulator
MEDTGCCAPDENPLAALADDEALVAMAKAIGHPLRLEIIRQLADRSDCVCGDLVEGLDTPQSTVSQHLKVLKDAGLVQGTISGRQTCYCLNRSGLRRFRSLAAGL